AFTVCDQHYCGVMSSTTPNRSTFWTGTVRDQQNVNSRVFMRNPEIEGGGMTWKTYPERLNEAGVSWKFYQNDLSSSGGMTPEERAWESNFGCNVLEYFEKYNVQLTPRYTEKIKEDTAAAEEQIRELKTGIEEQRGDSEAAQELQKQLQSKLEHLERLKDDYKKAQGRLSDLSAAQQNLHKQAFVTNESDPDFHLLETISYEDGSSTQQMKAPKGDLFHQFRKDVNDGNLPAISWLVAPEKFSDHPTSPWYGAWYVSEAMDILTKNPEVWKKTIFILTYDENDGYFDHSPSFVAADPRRKETGGASNGIDTGLEYTYAADELAQGVSENEARSGPIGLGYRVPMIIASPWSRGGWVNSQLFEHTSTLQFLEKFVQNKYNKRVDETNISTWRRSISGDLSSVFRPYDGKKPILPFLNRDRFIESIQRARYKEIPSNYKSLTAEEIVNVGLHLDASKLLSRQEPGVRQACSIPYEIYADAYLNTDRQGLGIRMRAGSEVFGSGASGVPFNVYLYGTRRSSASVAHAQSSGKMMAATYVVKAGDELNEMFPLHLFSSEEYDVAVHGPNGFFREFIGCGNDPALNVACNYQHGKTGSQSLSGNVQLDLGHTGGSKTYRVQIIDNSYSSKPITKIIKPGVDKAAVILDLSKQHGWYDFSVQVDGLEHFEKRYAGHVETGQPSYTDPLMGGSVETA
ncbi:MAG: alkaline phosphatase family protein, partial [Edaphobacter sp.]